MVVPYDSAPVVYKNMLLVGANTGEAPATGQPGDTRGYDARTGAKVWDFHSVPEPGEPGHESWEGDGWKGRSGVNNWGFSLTVDTERGIVYTVFGGPNTNYWGGDRHGNDLFGNSVVALDAETGKMKWYYQVVHHDIFDYDLPPAPLLMDVTVNGKKVPILAQTTKSGYMYILDRVTGKPVFGVEERPVPKSDVPDEQSSPTQPIPVKPPPLARNSFKAEDVVTAADTSAEHAKFCQDLMARSGGFINEGPFTPYPYRAGALRWFQYFVSGLDRRSELGRDLGRSAHGVCVRQLAGRGQHGLDREEGRRRGGEDDRNSIVGPTSRFQWSEGDPRRGKYPELGRQGVALPETTMGPVDGHQRQHRRCGVEDSVRRHRRIACGQAEHRPPEHGRLDGDRGAPAVRSARPTTTASARFDAKTGKQLWEARVPP